MRFNRPGLLLQLLVLSIIWSSCASTIYIAPKQADCTGASDQKCYLIRRNAGENWILHNEEIKGFDYEPGFSYKIKTKKESIKNPLAGTSSFRFILVEVLEKNDVTDDMDIEDLANKEWKLELLKQDRVEVGIETQVPTLKFEADGKVAGFGGCNSFFGSFTLDGRTIKIGDVGTTRKLCEEGMELENAYLKVLGIEVRALFSDSKLILTGDGGNQMIFGYK